MSLEAIMNGRIAGPTNYLLAYFLSSWGSLVGVQVCMRGRFGVWWLMATGLGLLLVGGRESITLTLSSSVVERVRLRDVVMTTILISRQFVRSRGKLFITVERQQQYARLS